MCDPGEACVYSSNLIHIHIFLECGNIKLWRLLGHFLAEIPSAHYLLVDIYRAHIIEIFKTEYVHVAIESIDEDEPLLDSQENLAFGVAINLIIL